MKLTIILLLTLLLFGCENNQATRTETLLYECMVSSFKAQEVNLQHELDKIEKMLIANGGLTDGSGQAYHDFYARVIELNDIRTVLDYDELNNINKVKQQDYFSADCTEQLLEIDSVERWNTKMIQLTTEMATIQAISPANVAKVIHRVLTPADFNKPLYRAMALLTITHTSNSGPGISRKSGSKPIDSSEFSSITISINEKDELRVDEKLMDLETACSTLKQFVVANQADHMINFQNEAGTSYNYYIEVQDAIINVYAELRNEKAEELFQLPFEELDKTQASQVKTIYPKRILSK